MARLTDQPGLRSRAQHVEETARDIRLEGQARRELHQKHAQLCTETFDLPEKAFQKVVTAVDETALMGDGLRHLDGEAEVLRHGACPALIGLAAVRLVEGRVDLDDRKVPGVAF